MPANVAAKLPRSEFVDVLLLAALAAIPLAPLSAAAAWLLLAYWPGGFVIRASGIGGAWTGLGRAILRLALSIALTPVLLNPLWHWTNDARWLLGGFVGVALLAEIVLFIAVALRGNGAVGQAKPGDLFDSRGARVGFAIVAAVVAFGAIGTYWPDYMPGAGPLPSQIHDYIKHHAVLFSMERRPLPLGNPFYVPCADGPAYYYHFFYLIPATVRAVAPSVSIALAFGVQAALVGIATAGMCALLARRVFGGDGPALLAACLATVVGGLDVIPLVLLRLPAITLDTWADTLVRIHNLLTQMVWTPQNVQGVLIALVGAYALSDGGRRWALVAIGPLLIAALVGSSVWVAPAVLPGVTLWVLLEVWRRRGQAGAAWRMLGGAAVVGLVALAISLPALLGYAEMSRRLGKGLTLVWDEHQSHALLGRFVSPGVLANLLDLPWVLAIELGALVVLPLLLPRTRWRAAWDDRGVRLLLLSTIVALVGFVTLRSHFRYNDFGQKVVMIVQIAGAVVGAGILATNAGAREGPRSSWWRLEPTARGPRNRLVSIVFLLLIIGGLPVALWQTPMAALRRFFPDRGPLARFTYEEARRARREAGALRFLREELPPDAVVQAYWGPQRLDLCQMIDKQIGASVLERDTMVFQVGEASEREASVRSLEEYFAPPLTGLPAAAYLQELGVTHVFVGEVERELWGDVAWLRHERYFHVEFEEDGNFVVRVKPIGDASAE